MPVIVDEKVGNPAAVAEVRGLWHVLAIARLRVLGLALRIPGLGFPRMRPYIGAVSARHGHLHASGTGRTRFEAVRVT